MPNVEVRRDSGHAEESAIADFERASNVRLSQAYRSLLLAHEAPRLHCADFDFIDRSTGALTSRDVAFRGLARGWPGATASSTRRTRTDAGTTTSSSSVTAPTATTSVSTIGAIRQRPSRPLRSCTTTIPITAARC